MGVTLPYNLQEGTIAYALKVMANFRALLNGLNILNVEGLGQADVATLMNLLYEAMVKANEDGNAGQIKFADGDTLEEKFAAGTLNASLLDSEGMFYFHIDSDGHLIVTAAEGINEHDFEVGTLDGHLYFTLRDPNNSSVVHEYDLGQVVGDKGDPGEDGMLATTYDPNGVEKDLNTYTGFFTCDVLKWGAYFLTEDSTFDENKTYYTYDSENEEYTEATVTPGGTVTANTYYEKLNAREYRLTDDDFISGSGTSLTGHITAVTGHAFIGPDYNNDTDEEVEAWTDAMIRVVSQGAGQIVLKALGTIPEISIGLQVTTFF